MNDFIETDEDLGFCDDDFTTALFPGAILATDRQGRARLLCPVCDGDLTHIREAYSQIGSDRGAERVDGVPSGVQVRGFTSSRRGALVISVEGECGHTFELVFQQHKGVTNVSAVLTSTPGPEEEAHPF